MTLEGSELNDHVLTTEVSEKLTCISRLDCVSSPGYVTAVV